MTEIQAAAAQTILGPPVLVAREDKIVTLTLNRPEGGNRWRKETLLAFEPIVEALHKDEEARSSRPSTTRSWR